MKPINSIKNTIQASMGGYIYIVIIIIIIKNWSLQCENWSQMKH